MKPRVLDVVAWGVFNEMPGELFVDDLHEMVLEGGLAYPLVDRDGTSDGELGVAIPFVDDLRLLGLVFQRAAAIIRRIIELGHLDMDVGLPLVHREVERALNLELLDLEEDHIIGV